MQMPGSSSPTSRCNASKALPEKTCAMECDDGMSPDTKLQTSTVSKDFLTRLQDEPETLVKVSAPECQLQPQAEPASGCFYTPRLQQWFTACQKFYQAKFQNGQMQEPVLLDIPGGQELRIEYTPCDTAAAAAGRFEDGDGQPYYCLLRFSSIQSILLLHGNAPDFIADWKREVMPTLQKMVEDLTKGGTDQVVNGEASPMEKDAAPGRVSSFCEQPPLGFMSCVEYHFQTFKFFF